MRRLLRSAKRDGRGADVVPERDGKTEEMSPEGLDVVEVVEVVAVRIKVREGETLEERTRRRDRKDITKVRLKHGKQPLMQILEGTKRKSVLRRGFHENRRHYYIP